MSIKDLEHCLETVRFSVSSLFPTKITLEDKIVRLILISSAKSENLRCDLT